MNELIFLIIIFLPLIFALFLLAKRLMLSFVNKKILNYGLIALNSIIFTVFLFIREINLKFNFFSYDKLSFDIGVTLNQTNYSVLIYSSFVFLLLSIFSKIYFKEKKQFMLTKLRYYIFLSLFEFLCFAFVLSENLYQNFVFWVLGGVCIFTFSYFDIFKLSANYNITRFYRIFLLGDICFLLGILTKTDFLFIIAMTTRFFVFPFSCFSSFFANASNLFYVITIATISPVFALCLFLKNDWGFSLPYLIFAIILSLFFVLFEKNFKIIFAHAISVLNCAFILSCYCFNQNIALGCYFILHVLIFTLLFILFLKDKISFKKRLINKQNGFILERCHIFLFENLPLKIGNFVNFINEKVIQTIIDFFVLVFDILGYYFVLKTKNKSLTANLRNILITFIIFGLIVIFIALFGNFGEVQY